MNRTRHNRELTEEERSTVMADLKQAERFLELLAQEKAATPPGPAALREALSLAAVVSYWRPFASGRPSGGKWLSKDVISTPELRQFHTELDVLRNKVWAHTTGKSHQRAKGNREIWSSLARVVIPKFCDLIHEVKSSVAGHDH